MRQHQQTRNYPAKYMHDYNKPKVVPDAKKYKRKPKYKGEYNE